MPLLPLPPAAALPASGGPAGGVVSRSASASRAPEILGGLVRLQYRTVRKATRAPTRMSPPTTKRSWVSADRPLEPLEWGSVVEVDPGNRAAGAAVVVDAGAVVDVEGAAVVVVVLDGLVVAVGFLVAGVVGFLVVEVVGAAVVVGATVELVGAAVVVVVDGSAAAGLDPSPSTSTSAARAARAAGSAPAGWARDRVRMVVTALVPLTESRLRPAPRMANPTADAPGRNTSCGRRWCAGEGSHHRGDTLHHANAWLAGHPCATRPVSRAPPAWPGGADGAGGSR